MKCKYCKKELKEHNKKIYNFPFCNLSCAEKWDLCVDWDIDPEYLNEGVEDEM